MRKTTLLLATIFLILISGCISNEETNSWATKMMQIDKLHSLGLYGSGIVIGIIDTGVDLTHGELDSSTLIAWHDYINNKSYAYDDVGHGTLIAGILFAKGNWFGSLSGYNLKGVCPDAKAVIVKAVSKTGESEDEYISKAIDFCVENGANIILLSLYSNPEDIKLGKLSYEACINAIDHGVIVVVPAGDDGEADDGDVNVFTNISEVISVGSIRRDGYISTFSSRGNQAWVPGVHERRRDPNKKPELVAVGENIVSTYVNGAYIDSSGTSQAAAYVAGIIALLLEAYPDDIDTLKEVLARTAKKVGGENLYNGEVFSHNDRYGYGLIQAYNAYVELGKYMISEN